MMFELFRCNQIEEPTSSKKGKDSKKIIIVPIIIVGFIIISVLTFFSWKWIAKHRGNICIPELYRTVSRRRCSNKSAQSQAIVLTPGESIELVNGCTFHLVIYLLLLELGKKRSIDLAEVVTYDLVDTSLEDAHSQINLQELPLFKFEILANATNNFSESNNLEKGGFGPIYKGEWGNGREIAIKQLWKASTQGVQEFMNELVLISRIQHRNLVRLLGCCIENRETTLIYEYMPNKSLDFFLFG